jgi:hypothetical protein
MRDTCYLTKKNGGIYIDAPYDEGFLETLKMHVPPQGRSWNPDMKQWFVKDKYANQAERDCRAHFDNVIEC